MLLLLLLFVAVTVVVVVLVAATAAGLVAAVVVVVVVASLLCEPCVLPPSHLEQAQCLPGIRRRPPFRGGIFALLMGAVTVQGLGFRAQAFKCEIGFPISRLEVLTGRLLP